MIGNTVENPHLEEFGRIAEDVFTWDAEGHDFMGRAVGHLMTFDKFLRLVEAETGAIFHHFLEWGCLVDEPTTVGLDNVLIGFPTRKDAQQYQHWLTTDWGKRVSSKKSLLQRLKEQRHLNLLRKTSRGNAWYYHYM